MDCNKQLNEGDDNDEQLTGGDLHPAHLPVQGVPAQLHHARELQPQPVMNLNYFYIFTILGLSWKNMLFNLEPTG